jgi:GNAT superfamily N-acetyltransferase
MTSLSVVDYVPDHALDAELAALGHAALSGWPDQRPFTPSLVRSSLRPLGTTATTLVLGRADDGTLRAMAALRWPTTLDSVGLLWGPIVHPDARGLGLATSALRAVTEAVAARPGAQVCTAGIPESRAAGWALFERAGWIPTTSSAMLSRAVPDGVDRSAGPQARAANTGEYLDQALAALVSGCRPEVGYATARDTFTRWTTDARYTSDGLLLVDGADRLLGAALVYPGVATSPHEPAEAFIADLITCPQLAGPDAVAIRAALIDGALRFGIARGAEVARAITDDRDVVASLRAAGFDIVDRVRYYRPPVSPSDPTQRATELAGALR